MDDGFYSSGDVDRVPSVEGGGYVLLTLFGLLALLGFVVWVVSMIRKSDDATTDVRSEAAEKAGGDTEV